MGSINSTLGRNWSSSHEHSRTVIIQPSQTLFLDRDEPDSLASPSDQFALSAAALFCCIPIGLFAVAKSIECRIAINRGQLEMADILSQQAKAIAGVGIGFGLMVVLFLIGVNLRDQYINPTI